MATPKKRLKSDSMYGQGLRARAAESKGKKSARLKKDASDEERAFRKLPKGMRDYLIGEMSAAGKKKTRIK